MEPIRPYKIFYNVCLPVNSQIFQYITQRMLLALKCYKRNCWTVHETRELTEKTAVQKIHIDNGSEGIISHPQVIEFQTVYSSYTGIMLGGLTPDVHTRRLRSLNPETTGRETIKCEMETKNIPGVPDGRHEVFYIADTDEFVYRKDPKVSDYMNIIFAPLCVDILYKDIEIIVATLRFHHDAYEHTKEVQERKMEHRETDDDKCDAAWQQELLHLSETLRQMNTEHTGVRYETILFHRGKHAPPVLFAYVVQLPCDVLRGVIVIAANLNDDTALELRYYETCSGLLSTDDKTTVMSITHAGIVRSGYDEAYRKLCANVGKDHADKIVGMVQETTCDPIKQKEGVMADTNKWAAKLENIHNKIQQFKTERFSIESNFLQWSDDDDSVQITVYLRDKADDGEPFGEIRYTANERHYKNREEIYNAGLTIRYFSNRQDVHWCEPLSIVDAKTGKYIAREKPPVMLKDLGAEWTAKFIGLLRAESSDEPMIEEDTNKKEEGIVPERTHTIELRSVMIRKAVLPEGCDEHYHIALKIYSVNDDVHKQIFKMYEDCPLDNPTDAKERYAPSRDGDTTTIVIFVPNADEIDLEKICDYYSTITLTLDSILVPGTARLNAEVKHIKVPSIGEWDGLPKKQHGDEPVKPVAEPVKPTEDKWVRFIEDMEKMFNRQNDKPRFKHMKFEPKLTRLSFNSLIELDVKCFIGNDRIGMFTVRMNTRPSGSEERVPIVIRFFPECNVPFCEGIYWIDGCKHAALHINKQTGGYRPFYDDMVKTVGIKFVQFFEQWLKNKLECINASDCEEDIEDVDEDTTDEVETVELHDVTYRVIKHVEPIFTIAHIIGLKDDEADRLMQLYEKCTKDLAERFEHVNGFDPLAMEPKRLMYGIIQIPIVCYSGIAGIQLDTVGLGISHVTKMKIRYDQGKYIPELYADDISIADSSQVSCDKPNEEVEDMKAEQPKFGSSITQPREFTLRDVAIRVLPHAQDMNPIFVEFAPISELEKMAILDIYNSNPLDRDEAKRKRIDPQFWRIRGTNAYGVRLSVYFFSSDMFQRLESARPYERFDVKLSLGKGQINITVESLTFKKMIHSSLELFEHPTATELTERSKRLVANSTYGMMGRSFDECVEEAARYVQAIYPESDTAKKLTESIQAISANPGETIWIDSLGCNKTKNSGGTTMRSTSVSIEKLFFNGSTTIVMWTDGTKTVVQPTEGEKFDPEIGIAMAIARKLFGSRHKFDKFVDEKVSDLAIRNAKAFTDKELATLIVEHNATITAAKKKHAADKEAYNAAKAAGAKKLPVLSGLKSDRRYRYAKIMIDAFTAEQEERKRKKAARAASTKKDTKKSVPTKKPTTKKSTK